MAAIVATGLLCLLAGVIIGVAVSAQPPDYTGTVSWREREYR